ncbi:MAG TPA: substrate-binding domain-containing protein [Bryobacteraceae bacterium]|nr:substrate-binding domain-containing protein [Bryobacteraceae bacterium]
MHRRQFLHSCCLAGSVLGISACRRHGGKVIGVIPKGRAHLFWQSVHGGAVKAAREGGAEVLWNGPATETDYAGQLEIVESMINRHVDAIVLAPIDRRVMARVVDRASSLKIPVVIFDSGVDTENYISEVATDNYKAGQTGADRLAKILGGAGKIAMVKVQPGAASTEAREKGFIDQMTAQYPKIQIVDQRFGMADFAKSLAISENMINAHPDLDGMFSSNESSTVGAARALRARRGRIKLVGFDSSPALLDDLKQGIIDSLVVQNPFGMGYESVKAALAALRGEKVPKQQPMPPLLVTRENVDDPAVQAQLNPDLKPYIGQ